MRQSSMNGIFRQAGLRRRTEKCSPTNEFHAIFASMEIDTLRLLVEITRLGSFAAVSRARDIDPSMISRLVSQAEGKLGTRVFQRTTRRLSLTESGARFIARIAPLVDEYDQAIDETRNEQALVSGTVRLTASIAFGQACLLPLVAQFRNAYPELKLELILSDSNIDLVRERIDLAVRLTASVEGDLIRSKLCRTRLRVCASAKYLAASPPIKIPNDLEGHPCLLFDHDDFQKSWVFRDSEDRVTEVPVNGNIAISNGLCLRFAALDDLGPALLGDWLINEDLKAGRLVDIFPNYEVTATTFDTAAWLVYPSRSYLPARVRHTIDFFRKHLGDHHF